MRIAICAPFMKSDIWQERLRHAVPGCNMEFDEFYRPEDVRNANRFRYHACMVAMAGAAGMESAIAAREQDAALPILWLSDDDHFSLVAYNLQVSMFFNLGCSDRELADAIYRCKMSRHPLWKSQNTSVPGVKQEGDIL